MTTIPFKTNCTISEDESMVMMYDKGGDGPPTPPPTRPPPPSYPPPPPPTTTTISVPPLGDHHRHRRPGDNHTDDNADERMTVVHQRVTDVDGYSGIYTGMVCQVTQQPHGVGKIRYDGTHHPTTGPSPKNIHYYSIYEGFWRYGSKDGSGRNLFLPDQDLYIGEYQNNVRNGYGQYFWKDGRTYDGPYVNDVKQGHGIFRYPNGESYVG